MKSFLAALLFLTSTQSFAHPQDNEMLANIGVGSELEVIADINIPPNYFAYHINGSCMMNLKSKQAFDRVLTKGKVLKITGSKTENYSAHGNWYRNQILFVDNLNIANITCIDEIGNGQPTTIGKFKKLAEAIFKIKLANPQEI